MRTLAALVVLPTLLAACGGDDGGSSNSDARQVGDGASGPCTASETGYGNAAVTDQFAFKDAEPPTNIKYGGALNTDPVFDSLWLELWADTGAFTGGEIAIGTYSLTGEEADYATCGVCLEIDTDIDEQGNFTDIYFANGGSLTINSVTPNISGTVTAATFVHSDFAEDDGTTTPNASGCQSSVASVNFDVAVDLDTGGALRSRVRIPLGSKHALRHKRAR